MTDLNQQALTAAAHAADQILPINIPGDPRDYAATVIRAYLDYMRGCT